MNTYKVFFDENKAVSANVIPENFGQRIGLGSREDKKFIESMIVWGFDEDDALQIASQIAGNLTKYIH